MTKEEAWEMINSKKAEENQYGLFFNLTSGLPESFRKSLEEQLINMVIMGDAMGKSLSSAEPGSSEFNKMATRLTTISQKTRIQVEEEYKQAQSNIKQRDKDAE